MEEGCSELDIRTYNTPSRERGSDGSSGLGYEGKQAQASRKTFPLLWEALRPGGVPTGVMGLRWMWSPCTARLLPLSLTLPSGHGSACCRSRPRLGTGNTWAHFSFFPESHLTSGPCATYSPEPNILLPVSCTGRDLQCLKPGFDMRACESHEHKVPADVHGNACSRPVCACKAKGQCWSIFLYHSLPYCLRQGLHCSYAGCSASPMDSTCLHLLPSTGLPSEFRSSCLHSSIFTHHTHTHTHTRAHIQAHARTYAHTHMHERASHSTQILSLKCEVCYFLHGAQTGHFFPPVPVP